VPLEETLGDFDLVPGPETDVLGGIFSKPANVVNGDFGAPQETNMSLIGKIIKAAGGVDGSQQSHVFGERDA
jgi:hypothetical protein